MLEHHDKSAPAGAQALFRGLAVLDAVARGASSLADIGAAIGCTRSTTPVSYTHLRAHET